MFVNEKLANFYDKIKDMDIKQLTDEADVLLNEQEKIDVELNDIKKRIASRTILPEETKILKDIEDKRNMIRMKTRIIKKQSIKLGCTY